MRIDCRTSSLPRLRAPLPSDIDFTLASTPVAQVVSAGGTSSTTTGDSVFTTSTAAVVDTHGQLAAQFRADFDQAGVVYTNLDTAIGSLGSDRIVRRVADGVCRVNVRASSLLTKQVAVPLSRAGGQTAQTFVSFVAGSLAANAAAAIDSRIAGKTSTAWPLFSARDTTAGTYTLNASRWCSNIDLSGVSANTPATLITPRHVMGVEHYVIGTTLNFVKQDGTVVTRTVTASANVGPANATDNYATDIRVGRLDSDVPSGVTPVQILPSGSLATKLPGLANGVPCVALNQFRQCMVHDWYVDANGFDALRQPTNSQRAAFYTPVIGGDSGSPVFVIINGAPVMLTSWTHAGDGVDIRNQVTAINGVITSLGGGGALSVVDLSSFTSF